MADILKFKSFKHSGNEHIQNILHDTAQLLSKYPMDQIVLGLFQAASDSSDVAVIMPSFSKVVLDNERK